MSTQTVTIKSLGAQGDGIAHCPDGPVYVPFALPGETVAIAKVKDHGTVMSITEASAERREPACRHFGPDGKNGTCGGCSLQHLADQPYHAYKRELVVSALKSKGLTPDVDDLVICRPGERRRAVFAARRTEKGLLLGFSQANSHHIVAIEECPVTSPGIVSRLDAIRAIGLSMVANAEPFRITVLETLSGLDISVEGIKSVSDKQRRTLTETVLAMRGIARVSLSGEILIEPQKPIIEFGGVAVSPPAGSFTQATKQAEDAMAELVLAHIGKSKRIADLFCGSGTFALRLARIGKVHAVEAEDKPLKALDFAARNTQGLKPVSVEKRDLFRRPLMTSELKNYDAVVFDPPRAGAEFQCKELARSTVKKIVAVSCNPLTLARDLTILTEGGYRITRVTPVDQFLWSPHVEAVATLEK
ncbi:MULTISPECIES: class I SAM-dependent RNA methyltransferase [unclassified Agrobacterium]|uniref:class I SAM-dependent RNA methyltransferase n=1 Tax=unclassified Agrobacterium TaxID=2632611 RepID=UPI00244CA102|nr:MULTISPECIES: class I SAM-dependent RNA methyltransferase [unclassified Agrobacterium]MDH0616841.1 class I SAM-dependent RNA methyltransferase [Agrobacterium sp. GD03872]MDH0699614.1 class I SAM-dependent RNA methyltransferase [Agrobacterium sp. GD03871]MDH1062345.1 class I SAM-dependent RNA methyltransferase [Agrobacterium sp. GD03992]MDH2213679.1 class I SAM-dependent RNA methyltransferase [Agrobacterium sp. GD03643]MDH2222497.1 class I SAM-dependent RNA methyltransferase [Agrobacterium s